VENLPLLLTIEAESGGVIIFLVLKKMQNKKKGGKMLKIQSLKTI
jgi:hypothetical protein